MEDDGLLEILTDYKQNLCTLRETRDRLREYGKKQRNLGHKDVENAVSRKFEILCSRVRTEPNFGNSTKGKKDNFLDGAEIMLTAVQYVRHLHEQPNPLEEK